MLFVLCCFKPKSIPSALSSQLYLVGTSVSLVSEQRFERLSNQL